MHAGIQDDTSGGEEESGLMEPSFFFCRWGKISLLQLSTMKKYLKYIVTNILISQGALDILKEHSKTTNEALE